MKILYYLRVFFIGYEFAFLIFSIAIYNFFGKFLESHFLTMSTSEEALKWAMIFPISISGWTLKDGVGVIFPENSMSKILHEWPSYWKLKAHFDIGVLNSIIYLLPCLFVWFTGGLSKFDGAWLFITFAIAALLNALSFYTAKIGVRSALLRAKG